MDITRASTDKRGLDRRQSRLIRSWCRTVTRVEPIDRDQEVAASRAEADLPASDLRDAHTLQLFDKHANGRLSGVAGVEGQETAGMPRSLGAVYLNDVKGMGEPWARVPILRHDGLYCRLRPQAEVRQ